MTEPGMDDEDLFADLYDGDDTTNDAPVPVTKYEPDPQDAADAAAAAADDFLSQQQQQQQQQQQAEPTTEQAEGNGLGGQQEQSFEQSMGMGNQHAQYRDSTPDNRPLIGSKEDGKMFIGGLNWETTDQSLKDYFSQFGEVVECTVMRDGTTGRSRGFGFLTFKDPKTVNTVMVKEHSLDGKLIDPKRAIPRDEQERTAKIFVGGVSQDATEQDFEAFFQKFGRVLDATLMMDKDTGRPRGFGFVTFDNEMAVERTLEGPLAILGKPIEVKRAQPRGKMGEEENSGGRGGFGGGRGGRGSFGGGGRGDGGFSNGNNNNNNHQLAGPQAQDGNNPNNMTPAMMAQYWQRMQQYFAQMQAMQQSGGMNAMMGGMNPMMMQQMQAMRAQQQGSGPMNPQMMQQMMAAQQGGGGGFGGSPQSPLNGGAGRGAPNHSNNGSAAQSGLSAQEQLMFEQQKYERQTMARMQGQNFGGQNTWEGMYDDVPPPDGMGPSRGGFGGRGGRGGKQGSAQPTPPNAPAGAPTGPKNHGRPGANYRGGGRGGRGGGFHPYARGGA